MTVDHAMVAVYHRQQAANLGRWGNPAAARRHRLAAIGHDVGVDCGWVKHTVDCETCGDDGCVSEQLDVDLFRDVPCPDCRAGADYDEDRAMDDYYESRQSRPGDPDWADPWDR